MHFDLEGKLVATLDTGGMCLIRDIDTNNERLIMQLPLKPRKFPEPGKSRKVLQLNYILKISLADVNGAV